MTLPIDSCQHVPFVPCWTPTEEIESHAPSRICGDVEVLSIITNRKSVRVFIWAVCAEVVVYIEGEVWGIVCQSVHQNRTIEQTATKKDNRTNYK